MRSDLANTLTRQALEDALAAFLVQRTGLKEPDAALISVEFFQECMQRMDGQSMAFAADCGWHLDSTAVQIAAEMKPFATKRLAEKFDVPLLSVHLADVRVKKDLFARSA